ncbi:MAG: sulfatase-like hydrolase/transferase [Chitinophagaceae bacterium]|nr:sulfatase-like hydrolase/transferase [Chitinophagaceae bacterium]
MREKILSVLLLLAVSVYMANAQQPNIVIIYADDLGYGDISCYGASKIKTPYIDKLAAAGIRFTNAHATSATCTPSRFSLMTGVYAWRKKGTGIAPGNASLIIPVDKITLPAVLKKAGYATAIVGKWHLGLGGAAGPDWNGEIKPGPNELGFDYSFILPATVDRVPCVYVENHQVANLDPADPIIVSYKEKVGDWPTGKEHPELLTLHPSQGHDQTIINGISRIGYMAGGKAALWNDDDIADKLIEKSTAFISSNKTKPFFLVITTHDIHVPRAPHNRFKNKSGLGSRGDVILQLDATVGKIQSTLDSLGISDNTMIIFSSDNGPVVDDGYADSAVIKLNGHTPSGPLRGGKYSAFDAGTRIPFIVKWINGIKPGKISNALFSQVDLLSCFAALTHQQLPATEAGDSFNELDVLLGKSTKDRPYVIEHANALSIIKGKWKYIEPNGGPAFDKYVSIELGNLPNPQLYDLHKDIGEKNNLAEQYPEIVKALAALLQKVKDNPQTREMKTE